MKPILKKKVFKTLQQKSFQCEIPQTITPVKGQPVQTPKSLSSSQGYCPRSPESVDQNKAQNEVKRVLTSRDGIRNPIRAKNPQHLRSTPQLGGLLKSEAISPLTNRLRVNLENPDESIELLVNRLRQIENLHRTQVSTLRVIISSLKRKFCTNQNQSQRDTQTSRSTNQDIKDEVSRLRAENQRLLNEQNRLIQELNQMAKARTLQRQMLSMQCSRLRMEVSSLKIKLLKIGEQTQSQSPSTPKICHLFSYPQYDRSKEQLPERISEIQSRFEISNARVGDKLECQYFTKCGRLNNTVSSGVKIHFTNTPSAMKARKAENALLELVSGSVDQISLLEIDSKEFSSVPSDNI